MPPSSLTSSGSDSATHRNPDGEGVELDNKFYAYEYAAQLQLGIAEGCEACHQSLIAW